MMQMMRNQITVQKVARGTAARVFFNQACPLVTFTGDRVLMEDKAREISPTIRELIPEYPLAGFYFYPNEFYLTARAPTEEEARKKIMALRDECLAEISAYAEKKGWAETHIQELVRVGFKADPYSAYLVGRPEKGIFAQRIVAIVASPAKATEGLEASHDSFSFEEEEGETHA
jgi:hypothetical protein